MPERHCGGQWEPRLNGVAFKTRCKQHATMCRDLETWELELLDGAEATYEYFRPNGRPYRPRTLGLRARAWENEGDFGNDAHGVVVLGTMDPGKARQLAYDSCNYWYGDSDMYGLTDAKPGWWRDTYTSYGRTWVEDDERGAPGVMFTWAEMDFHEMNWCSFCLIPVQLDQEPPHWPFCLTLDPTTNEGKDHG